MILDSEDEQHLEFLKQVFSDVPQSIFILKNRLENKVIAVCLHQNIKTIQKNQQDCCS